MQLSVLPDSFGHDPQTLTTFSYNQQTIPVQRQKELSSDQLRAASLIGRNATTWLCAFNRWRTVVSATWKYDDPRLNMSHEGAARMLHVQPRVVIFHVALTTVCHMFCRLTNYKNLELYVSWNHFRLCICICSGLQCFDAVGWAVGRASGL